MAATATLKLTFTALAIVT